MLWEKDLKNYYTYSIAPFFNRDVDAQHLKLMTYEQNVICIKVADQGLEEERYTIVVNLGEEVVLFKCCVCRFLVNATNFITRNWIICRSNIMESMIGATVKEKKHLHRASN